MNLTPKKLVESGVYAVMLCLSSLTLSLYVTDLFGNVIVKLKNIRIFDVLKHCHYILNPPPISTKTWLQMAEWFLSTSSIF